jgi:hypothetical protein
LLPIAYCYHLKYTDMSFLSLAPFVPSGEHFELSASLFKDLGFAVKWDAGDYIGFEKNGCSFILQRYNNRDFAENLMLNVQVSDADAWYEELTKKQLVEKYGIRISKPADMPYGREVNMIDIAGVCWHFVQ